LSIFQWAGLAVALSTLFGSLVATIRFLVKHYLSELRPNSGSSIKDQVSRLESRVDEIYSILIAKEKK
jgi:CHASE1-domain containing sensor protein